MQISNIYLLVCLTVTMFSAQETDFYISTELLTKPILTVHPYDTVWEGNSVTLTCLYETNKPKETELTYKWYREWGPLSEGILQNQYTINSAQQSHTGNYWCEVTIKKSSTEKKKSDKMKVTVKELFTNPTLTITPTVIWEGDTVTLMCSSVTRLSRTQLHYEYFKKSYLRQKSRINTGTIHSAQQSNAGWYICEAEAEGKRIAKKNSNWVSVIVKG
uniref:Ig-like domain-containing protein n=1 Tax=Erpetoichthys calabaricus TaxID=27687 RepID=A0A8C4TPQ0_ERPCA